MRLLTAVAVIVAALAGMARAEEGLPAARWPHWRGPLANGVAPDGDPPVVWSETKNVKWKAPLPGRGSTTPIIWDDQVFVLTAVPTERRGEPAAAPAGFDKRTSAPRFYHQFLVLCFDRATGKERWRHVAAERVPHEGHHETHSYAAGSPTTDGRRLYVSFGSFGIYAYTLDGKPLWQRDLGRLNTRLGWGEAVTPVIHGDSLLLNWDQEANAAVICLDAATGATKWRAERPTEKSSWNTPLVVEHRGRRQVVVNGVDQIRSYDLETGRELWRCGGMTVNAIPSPVAHDGMVYVMSGYRGHAAVAIALDAAGDVTDKVAWKHDRGTPYVPSPLLLDGRLYFTQANANLLTILDIRSGRPILDRARLPGTTSFYASPVAAAGRIYLIDRAGVALVLKQGDALDVLAANRLDDTFDASPVVVGKQLFLRGTNALYCIEE